LAGAGISPCGRGATTAAALSADRSGFASPERDTPFPPPCTSAPGRAGAGSPAPRDIILRMDKSSKKILEYLHTHRPHELRIRLGRTRYDAEGIFDLTEDEFFSDLKYLSSRGYVDLIPDDTFPPELIRLSHTARNPKIKTDEYIRKNILSVIAVVIAVISLLYATRGVWLKLIP
jgi:hypothetical protein